MSLDDSDSVSIKRICFDCVGDEYLSREINEHGKRRKCSYCGTVAKSISVGNLADRVEAAFAEHYSRTSDEPKDWELSLMRDRESNYDWDRDGMPVIEAIMDAADIPELAAEDVQYILAEKYENFDSDYIGEESEFSAESYYEERGTSNLRWKMEWFNFEKRLKSEARFFSNSALTHLQEIFNGVDGMNTYDGRPLLVKGGPGTDFDSICRARVFQSEAKLKDALCFPERELGPPPAIYARAGRMNARGISVFYGANSHLAAIAEVRPPVGSKVVSARFEIIRPVTLLDLTALKSISVDGSVFDPTYDERLQHAMFLRTFSHRITRPVMPEDEDFDYLATQAVADFLATTVNMAVDGIIFPSVQDAGSALNVVLFHKAARVEYIGATSGCEITAYVGHHDEDGEWETDYHVYEEILSVDSISATVGYTTDFSADWEHSDHRENTLKIVVDSLIVHSVNSVQFQMDDFPVSRYQYEKSKIL